MQNRGETLIESILAVTLAAIVLISFFQMFAYGRIAVDRLGVRRQGLACLQAEMEKYRFLIAQTDNKKMVDCRSDTLIYLTDNVRRIPAMLSSDCVSGSESGYLFQEVTVTLKTELNELSDTLRLSTRFYF